MCFYSNTLFYSYFFGGASTAACLLDLRVLTHKGGAGAVTSCFLISMFYFMFMYFFASAGLTTAGGSVGNGRNDSRARTRVLIGERKEGPLPCRSSKATLANDRKGLKRLNCGPVFAKRESLHALYIAFANVRVYFADDCSSC